MYKIFDFQNDLREAILELARKMGIKITHNMSLQDVLLDYLTVFHKIIPVKQRTVFICPQLFCEILTHPKSKEIETIIDIAQRGGNLNSFQNKRLLQSKFHDHMITEWNIYHFHLSLELDKKSGFVKQVNALLFAYIDEDNIVFLGTETHKDDVFGNIKWLTLLHDNFPQLIRRYKLNVENVYPHLSAKDRQRLWNYGHTTFMTKVGDSVYYSPNIGRTMDGRNLMVMRKVISILDWIDSVQKQLSENYELVCMKFNIQVAEARFKVLIYNGKIGLFELSSSQQILPCGNLFDLSKLRE